MKKVLLIILNICLLTALVWISINIFTPSKDIYEEVEPKTQKNNDKADDLLVKDDKSSTGNIDDSVLKNIFDTKTDTAKPDALNNTSSTKLPPGTYLKGTITGPANIARAMILIQGKDNPVILKTGDSLAVFILKEIHKDYVVFVANQEEVKLWIQSNKSENADIETTLSNQELVISEPLKLTMPKTREILIKTLDSINLDANWEIVSKDTKSKNNEEGLKITNIKALSPIAILGIKPNDTIVSINGQKLTNTKKAYQVIQKAKLQNKLSIVIFREGNEIKFDSVINSTQEE